ncbi:MAG TPA: hypothetical protein VFV71_04620 [Burkholderiales bacterium]|nr:hypothetical protein [Burkholderiales bacterium]
MESDEIGAQGLGVRSGVLPAAGLIVFFFLAICGSAPAASTARGEAVFSSIPPPATQRQWAEFPMQPDPDAPEDEAQAGRTGGGTPIDPRPDESFPAEPRNVFGGVDQVPDAQRMALVPFDYRVNGSIPPEGRQAIQGRNTWMLWAGGNEAFWGWLQQEHSYGLVDFLVLLDSRKRAMRFATTGLVNQPGMKARTDPSDPLFRRLGLYLDQGDGDAVFLCETTADGCTSIKATAAGQKREPFRPGDRKLYEEVVSSLATDGVDPAVYGYPSGIVGLRLWPNPDFFGDTDDAISARGYWNERVVQSKDAFYRELDVQADPRLVRPFRVGMTCGFCHVAPHPLNPPKDPENPAWENLSSTIGNQYWKASSIFANLAKPCNFLYQVLASEQPGTVDTSLISTDQINNPNTIIPIFSVPARLARAQSNTRERQSEANLQLRSVEDEEQRLGLRHVPRILHDGADSVGVHGALMRVYLNIGTYSEQWRRVHNPILGYTPQRPFSVATLTAKSGYWRTTEKYRDDYLISFFTYAGAGNSQGIAAPIRLSDTAEGREKIQKERAPASRGRQVFVEHCAICHSSKQPTGFRLEFSRGWADKKDKCGKTGCRLTLPMDFADWDRFEAGEAYKSYLDYMKVEGKAEGFLKDNFLSSEIRVPVTLVGTNSARAMGTNAMRGQVWDNFSSEDYKSLPAVGKVHFYNPYSGAPLDDWGNNDAYEPPGGGPGYYRPPSLIGIWATAPYLHNNALGAYIPATHASSPDRYARAVSMDGRLEAFEDGIDKLLWKSKRVQGRNPAPGSTNVNAAGPSGDDPGFIYRTSEKTWLWFPKKYVRTLVSGIFGPFAVPAILAAACAMTLVLAGMAWFASPKSAGFVLILIAVLTGLALAITRIDRVYWLSWGLPFAAAVGAVWFWGYERRVRWARAFLSALAVLSFGCTLGLFVLLEWEVVDMKVGPIPKGTPVNLIANLNPEAPGRVLVEALSAAARGILIVYRDGLKGGPAQQAFEKEAGLALLRASKCPDFVLDRGHWFGEALTDAEKNDLKAFLKTL